MAEKEAFSPVYASVDERARGEVRLYCSTPRRRNKCARLVDCLGRARVHMSVPLDYTSRPCEYLPV